jgi:hypothetical protein
VVRVHVDKGEFGAGDRIFRYDQGGGGIVFFKADGDIFLGVAANAKPNKQE